MAVAAWLRGVGSASRGMVLEVVLCASLDLARLHELGFEGWHGRGVQTRGREHGAGTGAGVGGLLGQSGLGAVRVFG